MIRLMMGLMMAEKGCRSFLILNWVPQELKDKLIPPIQNLFAKFRLNLEKISP